MKNIVLIGFMGTGKTSAGKLLAQSLGRPFLDLDEEIETRVGMTIADYFSRFGETEFRDREQESVERATARSGSVVATGGGVVLRQQNIDRLRATGVLVCLSASVAEIGKRTEGNGLRPLLSPPDRLETIRTLLEARQSLYLQADVRVETGGRTPAETAAEIERILREGGWLDGNGPCRSGSEQL